MDRNENIYYELTNRIEQLEAELAAWHRVWATQEEQALQMNERIAKVDRLVSVIFTSLRGVTTRREAVITELKNKTDLLENIIYRYVDSNICADEDKHIINSILKRHSDA